MKSGKLVLGAKHILGFLYQLAMRGLGDGEGTWNWIIIQGQKCPVVVRPNI